MYVHFSLITNKYLVVNAKISKLLASKILENIFQKDPIDFNNFGEFYDELIKIVENNQKNINKIYPIEWWIEKRNDLLKIAENKVKNFF